MGFTFTWSAVWSMLKVGGAVFCIYLIVNAGMRVYGDWQDAQQEVIKETAARTAAEAKLVVLNGVNKQLVEVQRVQYRMLAEAANATRALNRDFTEYRAEQQRLLAGLHRKEFAEDVQRAPAAVEVEANTLMLDLNQKFEELYP